MQFLHSAARALAQSAVENGQHTFVVNSSRICKISAKSEFPLLYFEYDATYRPRRLQRQNFGGDRRTGQDARGVPIALHRRSDLALRCIKGILQLSGHGEWEGERAIFR
jgi:hypothetical protein